MDIKRGQVYYIDSIYATGSEQRAGRPGIIVSNDRNNANSRVVEVVYMTTQPKADLPTHVFIRSVGRGSTALCEQIASVSIERLGDYIGDVNSTEMQNLEIAMLVSLGIQMERQTEEPVEQTEEAESDLPSVPSEVAEQMENDRQAQLDALTLECQSAKDAYEVTKLKLKRKAEELAGMKIELEVARAKAGTIHSMYEALLTAVLGKGSAE